MRIAAATIFLSIVTSSCIAQTVDSIDNIVLRIPASWHAKLELTFSQFTTTDSANKRFCQLTIYQQQPSTKDIKRDFKNEWQELIEKNFAVLTTVSPILIRDRNGNSLLRYGAKALAKNGKKYFVQLNVYDCGAFLQSVIAISDSKEMLFGYDELWQSLIVKVKRPTTAATSQASNLQTSILVGTWSKSSSSPPQYQNGVLVNLVNAGYSKGQYQFNKDGSYTFHGESHFTSNDYAIINEAGRYEVGTRDLILMPEKGRYQKVDENGTVKKQETVSLAKRVYRWEVHYFEGIRENNLVLSAAPENIIDGGYAANTNFPKSFMYSKEFKPEWKFTNSPHL